MLHDRVTLKGIIDMIVNDPKSEIFNQHKKELMNLLMTLNCSESIMMAKAHEHPAEHMRGDEIHATLDPKNFAPTSRW